MSVALAAYEADVEVREIEEPTADPEEPVQVLMEGAWHRQRVHGFKTGCGRAIDHRFSPHRHESYLGKICSDGCYSADEINESQRLNAEAKED